ncbi:MAG TPA: MCP four helix bundle domain-containing protein, partial [Planctomycetota bacterium]|nr:MCP four helix bundle domain-containing protein [Planctomycetota bacterium]
MRWTVGQRIAAGYAVILLFLVVVAGMGMYTLSLTTDAFQEVIRQRERRVVGALEARGASDRAFVGALRYRVTLDQRFLKDRERELTAAREAITRLRDTSTTVETKKAWDEVLGLVNDWEEASSAVLAAEKAGRRAEAAKIAAERAFPAQDRQIPL